MDSYKRRLDLFFLTVSAKPHIPGYTAKKQTVSNSLLDMTVPRFGHAYRDYGVEVWGNIQTGTRGKICVSDAIDLS